MMGLVPFAPSPLWFAVLFALVMSSTGIIVNGLAKPEYLMEIDIIAEIPADRA